MSQSQLMSYTTLAQLLLTDPICEVSADTQLRLPEDTTRYPFNVRFPVRMTQLVLGMAVTDPVRSARGMITLVSGIQVQLRSDGVKYDFIAGADE